MAVGTLKSVTLANGTTLSVDQIPDGSTLSNALYALVHDDEARYFLLVIEFTDYVERFDPGGKYKGAGAFGGRWTRPNMEFTSYKTRAGRIRRKDLIRFAEVAQSYGMMYNFRIEPSNYRHSRNHVAPYIEVEDFAAWCKANEGR
jgi:hypothetical protein